MPNDAWPERPAFPVREQGSTTNPTTTLVAGQALSERMRGRAELYRALHRTSSKNDYDFEARTIDALVALAASKQSGVAGPSPGRDRHAMAISEAAAD
jgi:hypothetical protein